MSHTNILELFNKEKILSLKLY